MSLISCAYMRLNTERAVLGATLGAVICTDPTTKRPYCLINWQEGACPCKDEIISHCDCSEPEGKRAAPCEFPCSEEKRCPGIENCPVEANR